MIAPDEDAVAAKLLYVMYAPADYVPRAEHGGERVSGAIAWQSRALIDRHQLACRIDFAVDGELRWWIDHWRSLRRIAFLIGCRCLRDELAADRRLLHLDLVARRFALLPVVAPHACLLHRAMLDTDDRGLHTQGFRLLDTLACNLPLAFRQRLHLLFHDIDTSTSLRRIESGSLPVYPMLISTATRYAQAHPY